MSEASRSEPGRDGWQFHAIGRRTSDRIPYMLPRHHTEIGRLDIQHYALRAALRGNYAVPLTDPRCILDIGSGTGQWAVDMSAEFPRATVVGLDVTPSKGHESSNYHFVNGDLLAGLPFADCCFDFVHQRLMITAIPLSAWPDVVTDMVRVTRSGGFVELVEIGDRMEPSGPATRQLWTLGNRLAAAHGLDSAGLLPRSLDAYVRGAGAVDVERHQVALPVGSWGDQVGSLMLADFRALFTRLCVVFEKRLGVGPGECEELLFAAIQECETYRTNAICTVVHGRKP